MVGSRLIEKFSRKKVFMKSVLFEVLAWIPMIAIAILYWSGIIRSTLPLIFLLFFSFYVISLDMGIPAWFSWTWDLVNERYRGRWFSKRNLLIGSASVGFALVSSVMLDYFKKTGFVMAGFIILFSLAFISRFVARRFYKKQYEPRVELKKGDYFSFFSFLMKARETNFGKFSLFTALFNLAISVASPLFVVYMLRDLHFSYLLYKVIISLLLI